MEMLLIIPTPGKNVIFYERIKNPSQLFSGKYSIDLSRHGQHFLLGIYLPIIPLFLLLQIHLSFIGPFDHMLWVTVYSPCQKRGGVYIFITLWL